MSVSTPIPRRTLLASGAAFGALALSGCDTGPVISSKHPDPAILYRALPDERFPVPAVPADMIHPGFYRREVRDPTGETPGTIVVDTATYYLYHVRENGLAMRYGVGLGKAGFAWKGEAIIGRKQKWPRWIPPAEMIARDPKLAKYSWENGGQDPGLNNPLGARSLYIYQDGKDTLYRVHSNPNVYSIGRSVSSGCVRMVHQDIIHLYDHVVVGSRIVVS